MKNQEKTGNFQENRKKPGRPKAKNPKIKVSWQIDSDIYQLLENRAEDLEKQTGCKPTIPALVRAILKKEFKS